MIHVLYGLFGGIGATLAWELLVKPKREMRSIAEVLAAEVSLNIQILAAMAVRADATRIPGDFHLSTYVFDALVDRIGELPPDEVGEVVLLYNQFHGLNRKVDLTRFDGHLMSPRLRAEVFDDITKEGRQRAA